MAQQRILIIRNKRHQTKGVAVSKRSIGTVRINGRPYTYNQDLMVRNRQEYNDAIDGVNTQRAKRKIYVRRR